MPKRPSFNFGANKPKKSGTNKGKKSGKASTGKKSNAWRSYVSSNAPIPP